MRGFIIFVRVENCEVMTLPSRERVRCGYPECKFNGQKRLYPRHLKVMHDNGPAKLLAHPMLEKFKKKDNMVSHCSYFYISIGKNDRGRARQTGDPRSLHSICVSLVELNCCAREN